MDLMCSQMLVPDFDSDDVGQRRLLNLEKLVFLQGSTEKSLAGDLIKADGRVEEVALLDVREETKLHVLTIATQEGDHFSDLDVAGLAHGEGVVSIEGPATKPTSPASRKPTAEPGLADLTAKGVDHHLGLLLVQVELAAHADDPWQRNLPLGCLSCAQFGLSNPQQPFLDLKNEVRP